MKCPKCKDEMKKGAILSYGGGKDARQRWTEEKSLGFVGFKFWIGKKYKIVSTYACEKCGYTESYIEK